MNERTHATSHDVELENRNAEVPGRRSASASLRSSDAPMASGILMRKAHGGTVDRNAEQAVGAASGSTGRGLPDDLRSRFEQSLGADLSSVRIHTGSESQVAAEAVGARAYAVGNDIHFAAGQYDPGSEGGQHLIAHEVAHTVQQRGGMQQPQFKLAVSSGGDSHEIEADRAADAMVRGTPAAVSGGEMMISRKGEPKADEAEGDGKPEKPKYPSFKDSSVTVPLGKALGGDMKLDWGDPPSASVSAKKSVKAKLFEKEYTQSVQLGPGIVGAVTGGISLEVSASAEVKGSGSWIKQEGKEEMAANWSINGTGEVGVEAKGSLQLSIGAGLANVLAVTGGVKGGLTAAAKASLGVTGAMTKNPDGTEQGAVLMTTNIGADLTADAAFVVDIIVPGDSINVYEKTLGKLDIGKAGITCIAQYANGQVTDLPPVVTAEWLPIPPPEQREKRKLTKEEQKNYTRTEVDNGAEGGSAEAPGPAPEEIEMSDEELFEGGKQSALNRLVAAKGKVVPVKTTSNMNGLMTVSMILDGGVVRGYSTIPPEAQNYALERGMKFKSMKSGSIVDWSMGTVTVDVVKKCAKTSEAVGRELLSNHIQVTVAGADFDFDQVPIGPCKKDQSQQPSAPSSPGPYQGPEAKQG